MPWYDVIWNHEPGGNVEHIAEHGLTPEDVEAVICNPLEKKTSRSSGRPVVTGYTRDGRLILVAVNEADEPLAYADLEANGHIDHLYCHSEVIGAGVASALYDELELEARARGMDRLFVEASEAALRLFARKGFARVERQDFILRGVAIHNYLMEKSLIARPW